MSGLVLLTTNDAKASEAPWARFASLGPFLHSAKPRDVAVRYFGPMADELTRPLPGVLAMPVWPSLPVELRRPLERTALTLGATLPPAPLGAPLGALRPSGTPSGDPVGALRPPPGANPLAGDPPAQRLPWFPEVPGAIPGVSGEGVPPPYGAGAFAPGVALLVGERSGVARKGQLKHRLPFVTFAGAGVGPWLSRQLEAATIPEAELYWVNAYDAVGVASDHEVVQLLQPRIVVAMGRLAERWCVDAGVAYVATLSPQEWRSARPGEVYPLGSILK